MDNHYLPKTILRTFWGERIPSYNLSIEKGDRVLPPGQGKALAPSGIMYEQNHIVDGLENHFAWKDDKDITGLLSQIRIGEPGTYEKVLGNLNVIKIFVNLYMRSPSTLEKLLKEVEKNTPVLDMFQIPKQQRLSIVLACHLEKPLPVRLTFLVNETSRSFILPDYRQRQSLLYVVTPFLAFFPEVGPPPWKAYIVSDPKDVLDINVVASLNAGRSIYTKQGEDFATFPFQRREQLLSKKRIK